jgi:hypothetical protein
MKNHAKIIKSNNDIYLEIEHNNKKLYFKINPNSIIIEINKVINLSERFIINLGKEE